MSNPINRRILLIDDTSTIHDDFRKILTPETGDSTDLDTMERTLFGSAPKPPATVFELTSAYGGQEGLDKLLEAASKPQLKPRIIDQIVFLHP